MHQILTAFGIDWKLLLAQAINFGLVLVGLWFLLYKPVMRILSERQALIEKSVDDARKTSEIYASADTEAKRRIASAEEEADEIMGSARASANEERARMLRDAESHAATIAKDAEARAANTIAQATKESEREVARLAVLAAEKVLREKS